MMKNNMFAELVFLFIYWYVFYFYVFKCGNFILLVSCTVCIILKKIPEGSFFFIKTNHHYFEQRKNKKKLNVKQ